MFTSDIMNERLKLMVRGAEVVDDNGFEFTVESDVSFLIFGVMSVNVRGVNVRDAFGIDPLPCAWLSLLTK